MTPTIEDVKKVAAECDIGELLIIAFPEKLQAFAQRFKEEGRKEQRESDAKLFECDPSCENLSFIAPAIRNNTGE